jgi:hypothetical protein
VLSPTGQSPLLNAAMLSELQEIMAEKAKQEEKTDSSQVQEPENSRIVVNEMEEEDDTQDKEDKKVDDQKKIAVFAGNKPTKFRPSLRG